MNLKAKAQLNLFLSESFKKVNEVIFVSVSSSKDQQHCFSEVSCKQL